VSGCGGALAVEALVLATPGSRSAPVCSVQRAACSERAVSSTDKPSHETTDVHAASVWTDAGISGAHLSCSRAATIPAGTSPSRCCATRIAAQTCPPAKVTSRSSYSCPAECTGPRRLLSLQLHAARCTLRAAAAAARCSCSCDCCQLAQTQVNAAASGRSQRGPPPRPSGPPPRPSAQFVRRKKLPAIPDTCSIRSHVRPAHGEHAAPRRRAGSLQPQCHCWPLLLAP
jgi:hypothetical protein